MQVSLEKTSMINNNETDTITTINGVNLQTEVSAETKSYLRIEAIRRRITMGKLLDEMVKLILAGDISKITS